MYSNKLIEVVSSKKKVYKSNQYFENRNSRREIIMDVSRRNICVGRLDFLVPPTPGQIAFKIGDK